MKLAVHAGTLRGAGSQAVGRATITALAGLGHELLTWVPESWPALDLPPTRVRRLGPGMRRKLELEALALPREAARFGARALLSLTDTSCPAACLRLAHLGQAQLGKLGQAQLDKLGQAQLPHVLMVQQAYLAYPASSLGFPRPRRFHAKMRLMAAYFELGLAGVTQFVVQTSDMRAQLAARWGIEPSRITVIPSSVSPAVLRARAERPITSPAGLLCVTSEAPHKGHRFLPGLLERLRELEPSAARLAITLQRGAVRSFDLAIAERGLADRVDYLGSLEHTALLECLRRAGVVVIPSELESFGIPYYEALALGVPVVALDRGFAREACGGAGRYGRTASELAEHALALLTDPALRAQQSEASRARFQAVHHSWEDIAQRYTDLIQAS
ncbi:MAG: glycosyltransferase family 4 protein [Polyangiaceae bacterium]|nr:glycosyltransferase family 4 protein [Polyangiaceae bacterium]MCW5791036.1 glycosyltransferase family 4 protein [Polyangiaceae bacterium]